MQFSLAICTYNRARLLAQALESLAHCEQPEGVWELLLIDNNSRDDTRAVAESFATRLPLRYLFEPAQGLSAARNRALREHRGDLLLFTDDDLRFDADWLRSYSKAFAEQPQADWFGGRIRPLWPVASPRWLKDEGMPLIDGLMVRYDLGSESRAFCAADSLPFGASFALRRGAIAQAGEFRLDLGVVAGTPGRGEEAEYLSRLRRAGAQGFYVGASTAWHWQHPERFRWRYLYRHGIQKGVAEVRMNPADCSPSGPIAELMYGVRALVQLLKGRGDRARQCVINMGMLRGMRQR
jgi:glycosyltransferase involved in cell wall biosynthesis